MRYQQLLNVDTQHHAFPSESIICFRFRGVCDTLGCTVRSRSQTHVPRGTTSPAAAAAGRCMTPVLLRPAISVSVNLRKGPVQVFAVR